MSESEGEDVSYPPSQFSPQLESDPQVLRAALEEWTAMDPDHFDILMFGDYSGVDPDTLIGRLMDPIVDVIQKGEHPLDEVSALRIQLYVKAVQKWTHSGGDPIREVATRLPTIGEWASAEHLHGLAFEVSWLFCNFASQGRDSYMDNYVFELGSGPHFLRELSSSVPNNVEQALWGIGVSANDSIPRRDALLVSGAAPALAQVLENELNVACRQNAAWACSTLMRGKPAPELANVEPLVVPLMKLIDDGEPGVVDQASWGISFLADSQQQHFLDLGLLPKMLKLCDSPNPSTVLAASRALGSLTSSASRGHTHELVKSGYLSVVPSLLISWQDAVRKEAAWTLSNIAATSVTLLDDLMDAEDVLRCIVLAASNNETSSLVRKEAIWTIANITACGTPMHLDRLLTVSSPDVLSVLLDALSGTITRADTVSIAIEAVEAIVADDSENHRNIRFEWLKRHDLDQDFYRALSILQTHPVPKVAGRAAAAVELFDSLYDN